ncbi:hypothetical protein GGD81_001893 [Rhodobium orientis]|uniref:CRISPR-associated protein Cas6 C-terminal domain-containing protein n=1 Tax=Rhodobium orientis TaxID=34017 RepID=A0A327JMZ5_9HYPH|nr:hypothetical protein [Rhodobium orientis]MBB4302857.1 hypothetical protein [Rhodobium orientis]RAI26242.1 hypothetical protein CH339_14745 [Rhodobium orientis]
MTGQALNSALARGVRPASLSELAAIWQTDVVAIDLAGMAGFAATPSIGNKLRGALGQVLLESASDAVRDRRPCTWPRTSTAEIFFGTRPTIRLGDHSSEIAKPYVLEALVAKDGALRVRLAVFGAARERTDAVADALVAAMRQSVKWRELARDGSLFVPKSVEPVKVIVFRDQALVPLTCPTSKLKLVFLTPIDAERGNVLTSPTLILERIVRRTALMAPWYGLSLAEEYDTLIEAARAVAIEDVQMTSVECPAQGGHRWANALSPPVSMALSCPIEQIQAALLIGEVIHVGRGASLGLGRYHIV